MAEEKILEWIEHDVKGKGMPVSADVLVIVQYGDGFVSSRPLPAGAWNWKGTSGHGGKYDIIAYCVVWP